MSCRPDARCGALLGNRGDLRSWGSAEEGTTTKAGARVRPGPLSSNDQVLDSQIAFKIAGLKAPLEIGEVTASICAVNKAVIVAER